MAADRSVSASHPLFVWQILNTYDCDGQGTVLEAEVQTYMGGRAVPLDHSPWAGGAGTDIKSHAANPA